MYSLTHAWFVYQSADKRRELGSQRVCHSAARSFKYVEVMDRVSFVGPLHLPRLILASDVIAFNTAGLAILQDFLDNQVTWGELLELLVVGHHWRIAPIAMNQRKVGCQKFPVPFKHVQDEVTTAGSPFRDLIV